MLGEASSLTSPGPVPASVRFPLCRFLTLDSVLGSVSGMGFCSLSVLLGRRGMWACLPGTPLLPLKFCVALVGGLSFQSEALSCLRLWPQSDALHSKAHAREHYMASRAGPGSWSLRF